MIVVIAVIVVVVVVVIAIIRGDVDVNNSVSSETKLAINFPKSASKVACNPSMPPRKLFELTYNPSIRPHIAVTRVSISLTGQRSE